MESVVEQNPLGQFIKQRRTELGISQRKLAKQVGIPAAYLSQIEKGTRTWPQKYIGAIASELHVTEHTLALVAGVISTPELHTVEVMPPPPSQPDVAQEDFHIFYEPAMDEIEIKFYGNTMRPCYRDDIAGNFATWRDSKTYVLVGISIDQFLRKVLPDLLCAGEMDGPLGHLHIQEQKDDVA
jgi:transcriptional regulator with XRE-family HTH domain